MFKYGSETKYTLKEQLQMLFFNYQIMGSSDSF